MVIGKKKTAAILLRLEENLKKALEKEAFSQGRSIPNYIRHLLATHQDRQKKKS